MFAGRRCLVYGRHVPKNKYQITQYVTMGRQLLLSEMIKLSVCPVSVNKEFLCKSVCWSLEILPKVTPAERHRTTSKNGQFCRVVYRFGIFGRYSVGISRYLPYRYRRKTRSVHFGIKKGAVPPFFLKRGAMAPFLRRSTPFWKKRGEERGEVYKKGGNDTDRKIPIPAVSDTGKYRYRKNDWYHRGMQL